MRQTVFICILIILAIFFYVFASVPAFGASPKALDNPLPQQMFQIVPAPSWSYTNTCEVAWSDWYQTVIWWSAVDPFTNWIKEAEVPCNNSEKYMFIDHKRSEVKLYRVSTQINTNAYNL